MDTNNQNDFSDLHSISRSEARDLQTRVPDHPSVESISETFRALSEPTRVKILYLLASEEMCVHDITSLLNASQSSISHHLKILKLNNLVQARREGKSVYYSLAESRVSESIFAFLDNVIED